MNTSPRLPRHTTRFAAVTALTALTVLASAGAAWAAEGTGPAGDIWLDPMDIRDSTGRPISSYSLSLGGEEGLMNPASIRDSVVAMLAVMGWGFYRLAISIGLWLFDWALQMQILEVLSPVAGVLHAVVSSVIGQLGLVSLLIALAALAMVHYINQGKTVAALVGMFVSLMTAAIVAMPASNLTAGLAGQNGGLATARDLGLSVVSEIVTPTAIQGPVSPTPVPGDEVAASQQQAAEEAAAANAVVASSNSRAEAVRKQTTAQLATALVRGPHQLINYGAFLDGDAGAKCRQTYNSVVDADSGAEEARDKMAECDAALGEAADRPMMALTGVAFVSVGGGLVGGVAVALAVVLTLLVVVALWKASLFTLELLKGILPGNSRTSAVIQVAHVGMCLVMIVLVLVGVGVFVLTTRAVLTESGNPVLAFIIIDIILFVAIFALLGAVLAARKTGKKIGESVGKKISPDPLAGVAASGRPSPMRHATSMATTAVSTRLALRPSASGQTRGEDGAPEAKPGMVARGGSMLKKTGQGSWTVAKGSVKYTVGAPVYVPRAYGKAATAAAAKKEHMQDKIAAAKTNAGQSVTRKKGEAAAFTDEYVRNVKTAAAAPGKAGKAAARKTAPVATAAAIRLGRPTTLEEPRGPVPTVNYRGGDSDALPPRHRPGRARPAPAPAAVPTKQVPAASSGRSSTHVPSFPDQANRHPRRTSKSDRWGRTEGKGANDSSSKARLLDKMRARSVRK